MSFELNLASLPNHILYLAGVQLSYIKVYVHVFNLWHAQKPCFLSNAEFVRRTNLNRDTVINALQFFEKHGILKRVQKGTKRYLVQPTHVIEIEASDESVDNSSSVSTKIDKPSELDHPPVGVRPPQGSELDHHNNKINNKYKKSSCEKSESKTKAPTDNSKKHEFADSMNQMASEKRHIQEHEERKKVETTEYTKGVPESLKNLCANFEKPRYGNRPTT